MIQASKINDKIRIVINLDNSLLDNSENKENIIQQDAYKACENLLKNKLDLAASYDSKRFDRYHETITVQGERGTGKTSFILGIKKMIEENKMPNVKGVQTLDILDPTLLGDRQKVLLIIISNIVEVVKNDSEKKQEQQQNEWHDKLIKLAEGLNSIINVGSDPSKDNLWDDAGLILEKGLIKAKAGVSFEKQFHEFIEYSLKMIRKRAFLLVLDDIDTNFKKGWDVLEIIRKYITTPHIITIISGDISLYNHIIRQEKWKLFEDLKNYEECEKYRTEVDDLQEQYLIKILKPENYINLYSLDYYLNYKKNDYQIIIKSKEQEDEPLEYFVNELFENMFGRKEYKKIFLTMPIRTNIQLFKAYIESKKIIMYSQKLESGKIEEVNEVIFNKKYFFQKVKDIFVTTFSNFNIDMQFFELLRDDDNINRFLSEFIKNEKLEFIELSEFKPQNNNNKINTNTNTNHTNTTSTPSTPHSRTRHHRNTILPQPT
ncbi:MAG: hypothetical protein HRT68_15520, partial [Flavobacteriaceae bacterium]|nr:hypothetical protein [Flavobacteriaceae bacterium]